MAKRETGATNDGGVEVHFDASRGELDLSCGSDFFIPLRDKLYAEVGLAEMDVDREAIHSIIIEHFRPKEAMSFRAWLGQIGFVSAGILVFAVFIIGVFAIVGWVRDL